VIFTACLLLPTTSNNLMVTGCCSLFITMATTVLLGVRKATASNDESVTMLDILIDPRGTNLLENFAKIIMHSQLYSAHRQTEMCILATDCGKCISHVTAIRPPLPKLNHKCVRISLLKKFCLNLLTKCSNRTVTTTVWIIEGSDILVFHTIHCIIT